MRQLVCVVIVVAALLWPMRAIAQDVAGLPCASATEATDLVLVPTQVGMGFRDESSLSPGHVEDMPPGSLDSLRHGFHEGPLWVLQTVNTFDGPDSATAFAAQEIQAQRAVVRCGVFVVTIQATLTRGPAAENAPPSEFLALPPLAWAVVGEVAGAPNGCVVSQGLLDGWLIATCDGGAVSTYNPDTGLWLT
jgi:hypothetical protein